MQESLASGRVVSPPLETTDTKLLDWETSQGVVIACVDRPGTDSRVVAHAEAVAHSLHQRLILAQVLEPDSHFDEPQDPVTWGIRRHRCRERLEWLHRQSTFEPAPEQMLLEGKPAEELSAWISEFDRPLLALATRCDERSPGNGLGSTAQRLLDIAPASLLLIPPSAPELPSYRRIVIALDGSPRAESVLPKVVSLARDKSAEVLVVHVVPQPQFTQVGPLEPEAIKLRDKIVRRNEQVARTYLERVLRQLRSGKVAAQSAVLHGDVREALVRFAGDHGADLIVLAAHGQTGRADMSCGSVTAYLACHTNVPILILREEGDARCASERSYQDNSWPSFMQ